MEVKAAKAKEFLADRNMVKVAMIMRGREMAYMNLAREKMNEFAAMLVRKRRHKGIAEKTRQQSNNDDKS